jgi:hypothetical protein
LLLNNCRAADGNGDSLEVMDLTFYLFGFCFLMNSIKSPILLERWERQLGSKVQWIMSWFDKELMLFYTLYGIGKAQSEKEMSEYHRLRFLKQNTMIRNQCFPNLICGASFNLCHCMWPSVWSGRNVVSGCLSAVALLPV